MQGARINRIGSLHSIVQSCSVSIGSEHWCRAWETTAQLAGNTPNMHEYTPNPWEKYIPPIDLMSKEPSEQTWSLVKTKLQIHMVHEDSNLCKSCQMDTAPPAKRP